MPRLTRSDLDRRRFLKAAGLGVLGTSVLGSMIAHAQAGAPKRLLIGMRPHGSIAENFFPQGSGTNFQLPLITSSFEPVKSEMIFLTNLENARSEGWEGEHDAGLFGMMTGKRGVPDGNGYRVGSDISIDQLLAQSSPLLSGTLKRSIQLAGTSESGPGNAVHGGNPGLRVMSYAAGGGTTGAMDPETRPEVALTNLFANFVPPSAVPTDQTAQLRARELNRAVLDQLARDANRLKARIPVSQQAKLDEQLSAIADLSRQNDAVAGGGGGQSCAKPSLAPLAGGGEDHAGISRQMLQLVKSAFACDLTRVATFTFAPEQSGVPFNNIIPNEVTNPDGHHDISHTGDRAQTGAIDKFYCQLFAELLIDMKNTPEGAGSMLDNTVVAFITGIDDGQGHGFQNMPVLLFGGKSLGLTGGRIVDMGGRTMNDVWTSVSEAFGVPGNFGEAARVTGPVNGLFTAV